METAIKGRVTGTGIAQTRDNEITADSLAVERDYYIGYNGTYSDDVGVIVKDSGHDFDIILDTDGQFNVAISDGTFCVYGYCGRAESTVFEILPPAVSQYFLIYVEVNRSVVPNVCSIKIKNNQSSPYYDNAFRQDVLSSIKTGVFELPLWRIKVSNAGIVEYTDIRNNIRRAIQNVHHANTTNRVSVALKNGVTCVMQSISDSSKKVASTEYVVSAIRAEINK